MMSFLRAAALAAAFVIPGALAPTLAADDAFTAACVARGKASAAHCACESTLARGALTAGDQAAMIRAMRGDAEGFRAAVAAMGAAPAQAFVAKVRTLQARTETACR